MDTSKSAPIAWPIAKLLDLILGANETHTYKKAELKSLLQFHRQGQEPLRDDEISILSGVLELGNKRVDSMMTPLKVNSEWRADPCADPTSALGRCYRQRRRCARPQKTGVLVRMVSSFSSTMAKLRIDC